MTPVGHPRQRTTTGETPTADEQISDCAELAAGRSVEDVLDDYPYLERADILDALEFAAAAVQERELPSPCRLRCRAALG